MKVVVWTVVSFMAAMIAASKESFSGAPAQESPESHFPTLQASNLEKRTFNLPADFEGERNLLLVAFEREQQKDVDTWLREMKHFEASHPGFHYYELPTIQRPNVLTRWFIDNGMRHGIPDRQARERTITLYIDKQPFCDALRITDQTSIHEFLVDRSGKVWWHSAGRFDEAKGKSLGNALQDLKHE